jgi:hypothetical protein
MKKIYNFINNYKIELIVILILLLISICIYYFYKKYNSYENFTTTTAITIDDWKQRGIDIDGEAANDYSGTSVALSGDGTVVAIGAHYNDNSIGVNSGHVRIFKWNEIETKWEQRGLDIDGENAYDYSGRSLALSSDGKIVAIGSINNDNSKGENSGHVRIHQWNEVETKWEQRGTDIDGEAANDQSGISFALSSDGNIVAIGAIYNDNSKGVDSGHVRIYEWINNSWEQRGLDIDGESANDQSGISIALSSDGKIVAIGAAANDNTRGVNSGHVRIYEWNNIEWKQRGLDIDGEATYDHSGRSVALSSDGKIVAIGSTDNSNSKGVNSGHVRIYEWNNIKWEQLGLDIDGEAANDNSGTSVALSGDGKIVAIGAHYNDNIRNDNSIAVNSGHVRIYKWNNIEWEQLGTDIDGEATNDQSGISVALSSDGSIVAIGASGNDNSRGGNSGHVRIYTAPTPIDCVADFVNSGECSKPCAGGKQKQIYRITTQSKNGGTLCNFNQGVEREIDCNTQPCNCIASFVNGICKPSNDLNLNCGPGIQTQKYVISQEATSGGIGCLHEQGQEQDVACSLNPCPINCVGSFGEYGKCTKDCDGGTKERVYTIKTAAQHGGRECPNKAGDTEVTECNTDPCPINCMGEFSLPFKSCSKECGTDGILLNKYVITQKAEYGGTPCDYEQNDIKSEPCNRKPCPTYPENTAIKEALKDSNSKIQKIRYDIINRQEELDLLTNKFNRVNKNISFIKNNTNYIPDDETLTFY